jgi:ADP-ribosylglycohydrolase
MSHFGSPAPTIRLMPVDPDAAVGCLLGQAVGDMMGPPAENLGPRRIAKLFPIFDRPRFLFGRGMGSDDTEHAFMTAQALLRSSGDRHRFRWSLASWAIPFRNLFFLLVVVHLFRRMLPPY